MYNIKKNLLLKPVQHFILLITLIAAGCCNHAETYMVPNSFKQYFYFPTGSWWVYKNQFDKYDTLTVTNVESNIVKMNDESCEEYEKITMHYKSSQSGNHELYTIRMFEYFSFCSYTYSDSYFNELTHFGTDTYNDNNVFGCSTEIQWWLKDTVVVIQKIYCNVYVNKTTSNIPSEIIDYPIVCYFKENIGLIKRELQNGEIWELIDYKINK